MVPRSFSLITVATCNLNQWALDFDGNVQRILESCRRAKEQGAAYRLGPELEIVGYGSEDHFLEHDTFDHCWESLCQLLEEGATDGLMCDFGMPVLHAGVRYNCRVICHNRKILLIRPKTALADNGNYREGRYFTAYSAPANSSANFPEKHLLPNTFFVQFGQRDAPFGLFHVECADGTSIGCESCEELWTPHASHIDLALRGVEIIGNGSGSHHELRKLSTRIELMTSATRKCGGVYLYANQRGCDGGRTYYDGCAMIVVNGRIVAQAPQFDVHDVNVITATIDLNDIRSYRACHPSFGIQAARTCAESGGSYGLMYDTINLVFDPSNTASYNKKRPKILEQGMTLKIASPEEECCLGPACWLWDYLRRSGAAGFFLPLSGGADSSSVAAIVAVMCILVARAARDDPEGDVANDCRRICRKDDPGNSSWVPSTPEEMAGFVLHTAFMGTENSSAITHSRAKRLGDAIGSYHLSIKIDLMVKAVLQVFQITTGHMPRFVSKGGCMAEDLALQNIQARLRMVTAYLMAQLLPWVRGRAGFLLVLGSANVDESLRGYCTKYDCSSADLNPIGGISKGDLKRMLIYLSKEYSGLDVLAEIANAPPTAELRPIDAATATAEAGHSQTDEEDMGMTYEELGHFGRLRKMSRCGPVGMFRKLVVTWSHLAPSEVAAKVKRFFYYYSVNRHKMTTITPAYHAEAYSPDDNRFDLRQFLYNTRWTRQFGAIDDIVAQYPDSDNNKDKND